MKVKFLIQVLLFCCYRPIRGPRMQRAGRKTSEAMPYRFASRASFATTSPKRIGILAS